jgi:hypothetical protein
MTAALAATLGGGLAALLLWLLSLRIRDAHQAFPPLPPRRD